MEVEVTQSNELTQKVEVTISGSQIRQEAGRWLKEHGKGVRVDGFRKGKAPYAALKKRFGKTAQAMAIDHLVRTSFLEVLEREDFADALHFTGPSIQGGINEDGDVSYVVWVEARPELPAVNVRGLVLTQTRVEVDAAEVDERIEEIRKSRADLLPVEGRDTVEPGDILVVSMAPSSNDAPTGLEHEGLTVDLSSSSLPQGFAEGLHGATVGSTQKVTIYIDAEGDDEEPSSSKPVEVEVQVEGIKRRELPEVDEEFAREVAEVETVEELRARVEESVKAPKMNATRRAMDDQIRELLVAQLSITIPEHYFTERCRERVHAQFREMGFEGEVNDEMMMPLLDLVKPDVERSIKLGFAYQAIAEAEGLEISQDEREVAMNQVAAERSQPIERVRSAFAKSERDAAVLDAMIRAEKVHRLIRENAMIQEVDPAESVSTELAAVPTATSTNATAPAPSAEEPAEDES